MKFHVNKWNKRDKEYTMLILTEEDVESESSKYRGAGFEIVILPKKYKDVENSYLNMIRQIATIRCGEIIYI